MNLMNPLPRASRSALAALFLGLLIAPAVSAQGTDCLVTGPSTAECGIVQFYVAYVPQNQNPFSVVWSLLNNTAGATFVGPNSCTNVNSCPVNVSVTTVGSVTVHATITTFSGVIKECEQPLNVVDVTPPSITCPPDLNVECGSSIDPSATGTPAAFDTCGSVTLSFVDTIVGSNCAGPVISRTWTALDSHGNSATCTQTLTTVDTTPPSIACPAPVSVECFSQVPPPNIGDVTASDVCSQTVTVTFVGDSASNGTSNCNNVITRTYQAQDGCGNTNTCTQTITVNDTTPPSITCPGPVTVQCFSQVPPPDISSVSTGDNCGGPVTVTFVGDSASNGTSNCNNVITRTYQAQDSCGNTNTCTQTITVNDTTPPSITCPGPVTVQCFSQVPPPDISSVSTGDNCGGPVTVTFAGDSASNGTSNCNNVITRTYQAQDSCGNTNTCTQAITVNDTTPPSITCPGPVSVQCFSQVPPPDISSVSTGDNCSGPVTVTFAGDSASNGTSSCNNVITRTYQAQDSCGNTNTCTQTITVNDTTPPSITCPGPVSVQCFSQVPAPDISSVSTGDNCGGPVTVTFVGDSASNGTSSCNNVITRTYQAQDSCGNTNTCTQTITVNDTTPPSITCPGPVSVQCYSQVPTPDIGSVTTSDNCGGPVTVTFAGDSASNGTSSCNNVITRTYQAQDSCGNTNTCTQTITVNDTTPPSITCPGPVTVECFSQVPAPDISSVSTGDNCGGPVTVTFVGDSASNGTANCNVITRTYQAQDSCGNTNTCTQTITVSDTIPPTITCPGPVSVQCFSQVPAPDITSVTTSDNCGDVVTVTFAGDSASNGTSSCNNVITRTYQAQDSCGNTNTCTQTITVNDTMPPVITCPPNFTMPCGLPADPQVTGSATAIDNCDPLPVIAFTDTTTGSCPGLLTITRTWTATDACNNQASCVQIIVQTGENQTCVTASVVNQGGGCGSPAPTLLSSTPTLGDWLTFRIQGSVSNGQVLLAAQLPPFSPTLNVGDGCTLHIDPQSPSTLILNGFTTNASGAWAQPFLIAAQPELANLSIMLQAAILTPGGPVAGVAELTNAIDVTLGNCPPYCTFSSEQWSDGGIAGQLFDNAWLTVFPSGMDIGVYNPGNGSLPPNGVHWTGDVAGRTTLKTFLGALVGTPGPLISDFLNPTTTTTGTLGRLTAVLQLNIAFNAAGYLGSSPNFGLLVYQNPYDPLDSLNGFTVNQILGVANQILAGFGPPPPVGYTYISFTDLLESLSFSFANCTPSFWGTRHLYVAP